MELGKIQKHTSIDGSMLPQRVYIDINKNWCVYKEYQWEEEREKMKDLVHFYYWENLEDNFHTQWYCMKCLLNELFP